MSANKFFVSGLKGIIGIVLLTVMTGVAPVTPRKKTAKTAAVSAETTRATVAPAEVKITFLPESKLSLNGDSSLRKYSSTAQALQLSGGGKAVANSVLPFTPTEVSMRLQVKDLKSGDGTLDDHMYEAMQAEKFQTIEMKLDQFELKDSESATAAGSLTVAGVTRPVVLQLSLSQDGEKIIIRGTKNLLMTDFGIQPPTMMMGTIKTKNEIEINFNVICTTENKQKG